MTDQQLANLNTLMGMRESAEAIEAALIEEANTLIDPLRAQVRTGNALEAAKLDAKILALEEVSEILQRYAAKYRRPL